MKLKYKKLWVRALQGNSPQGVYEQGFYSLVRRSEADEDRFCSLGVLVNEVEGFSANMFCEGQDPNPIIITPLFLDRVGLKYPEIDAVVYMNDYQRRSFAEIADWVEENL